MRVVGAEALATIAHAHSYSPSPTLSLQITEPYLQIYRGILPPLFGQLDFTPLFGFLILQVRDGSCNSLSSVFAMRCRACQQQRSEKNVGCCRRGG